MAYEMHRPSLTVRPAIKVAGSQILQNPLYAEIILAVWMLCSIRLCSGIAVDVELYVEHNE